MNLNLVTRSLEIVLLEGETGSGKSILAKRIHRNSSNFENKFIHLNVASLNENTFESELFGHKKGAFTGANTDKEGFCEVVKEGTLFVDEIGELSLEKQAKLLTLIDEKIFYPVGSTIAKRFRGRLIFATNKDLDQLVKEKRFREDLYFRIRFFSLKLSALREDFNLEKTILDKSKEIARSLGREEIFLGPRTLEKLVSYSWPGNYRELHNTLKYLYYLGEKRPLCKHLPRWLQDVEELEGINVSNYYDALRLFEKSFLEKQMRKFKGKINLTSEMIGISKVTLISKLKKYDINRRNYKLLDKLNYSYGI